VAQGRYGEHAREDFLAEAQELVETLSRDLLIFEDYVRRSQESPETLSELFRGVHTLKGLSGMFGFENIGRLAHMLEDTLDDLRMGRIEQSPAMLDVLFVGVDGFQRLLAEAKQGLAATAVDIDAVRRRIDALGRSAHAEHDVLEEHDFPPGMLAVLTEYEEHRLRTNLEQGASVYRLRVRLALDVIDTALEGLKERVKGIAEVITYLPSMDEGGGDSLEIDMVLATRVSEDALRSALDRPDGRLTLVSRKAGATPSRSAVSVAPLMRSLPPPVKHLTAPPDTAAAGDTSLRSLTSAVRVDIRKLDHLMNMVGELGTVRVSLQRLIEGLRSSGEHALVQEAQRLQRLFQRRVGEVQESVLGIRMVPLSQLFDKVAVVVRQVARDQGKDARLLIAGGETEVDKLVAEELADPMMHLVRNAIDHGVEQAGIRVGAHKPEQATLAINAYQKGNHVVVELSDDGAGIDPSSVRAAALEKGLATTEMLDELSAQEMLHLVFTPGFSTKGAITELSGRGVGMDVVKTNVTRMGGVVEIESEVGVGTKVTITLPITLAIISALLLRLCGQTFAIPVAVVREALRLSPSAVSTIEGREVLTLRGTTLPLCRLSVLLGVPRSSGDESVEQHVLVVAIGQRRVGVCVDRIVGQQDIVIKGLGKSLAGTFGVSGATDLGDQSLVLVLDAAAIVDEVLGGRAAILHVGAQP
jgi:two-component system, chemotaxis family, sensor kinase CheA